MEIIVIVIGANNVDEAQKTVQKLLFTWPGRLLYYLIPLYRKVMLQNIDIVYQHSLSTRQKKRLMMSFYSHLVHSLRELILLRFKGIAQLMSLVDVCGIEHLLQAREKGRGVLILTSHLGNFEFAPYITPTILKKFDGRCYVVRKTIGFKYLNGVLFRNCQEAGVHIIHAKGAIAGARRALAKNDVVYFALDQRASIKKGVGIAVEFFGKKAGTHRSLALLAMRTGAPVVPMITYRQKNGRHVVEYQEPLTWIDVQGPLEDTIHKNTQAYNQVLETFILAHPEQWWWLYRRWRN